MKKFKVIAFTHKFVDLKEIGHLHIEDSSLEARLSNLKQKSGVEELMYLSTCNRVEFIIASDLTISQSFLKRFFTAFHPEWTKSEIDWALKTCQVFEGAEALKHIFYVASSIDSLVVGEREIITQFRQAFEKSKELGLTGNFINLLARRTVEVAKKIYTNTQIAQKPVSVVSLAYRELKDIGLKGKKKVLLVGAGQTMVTMARFLKKNKDFEFTIFNRSVEKAAELGEELNAPVNSLDVLEVYDKGFDILITCTGASYPVITEEIYEQLLSKDTKKKKIVVDLALPSDVAPQVLKEYKPTYIGLESLKTTARKNLAERQKELDKCKEIVEENIKQFRDALRERQIELAMREVPDMIQEIREKALTSVFEKDIAGMDEKSREVLNEVIKYMEKKYISVPMKMAKNIMMKD